MEQGKVLILCEACGGYHPEDECEEVYVKVVKGKNCVLNLSKDYTFKPLQTASSQVEVSHITTPTTPTEDKNNVVVAEETSTTTRNIIPPGLLRMQAGGNIAIIPAAGNGNGARGNVSPASVFKPPAI
jgi:hypothetical protein